MNWKLILTSNWKTFMLLIQLGLFAITVATGHALADPIDNPWGP